MPYIKENQRIFLSDAISVGLLVSDMSGPGDLNYIFSIIAKEYFLQHKNYQGANDIIGALEGAKLEFYRRVVAPYEDEKIKENGDVY